MIYTLIKFWLGENEYNYVSMNPACLVSLMISSFALPVQLESTTERAFLVSSNDATPEKIHSHGFLPAF